MHTYPVGRPWGIVGLASAAIVLGLSLSSRAADSSHLFDAPQSTTVTGFALTNGASGDFDEDGLLDLLVVGQNQNVYTLFLLPGRGDGTFRPIVDLAPSLPAHSVATADFNGDGHMDIVVGAINSFSELIVMLGNGNGTFTYGCFPEAGIGPHYVAVADFNSDGRMDIVAANRDFTSTISVLLGTEHGTFGQQVQLPVPYSPVGLVAVDLNNDHTPDLAVVSVSAISIFFCNGAGVLTPGGTYANPAGFSTISIATADINRDGYADLVASGSKGIVVLFNDGANGFARQPNITLGANCVRLADINGDGNPDLVCTRTTSNVSVLLGQGLGTFAQPESIAVATPWYAIVSDMDGDGWTDVAVLQFSSHKLSVLLNNQGADACTSVVAGFSAIPMSDTVASPTAPIGTLAGPVPLTVQFTNLSTDGASVAWDFENDGTYDSGEQNPVHTFQTAGTYSVRVKASVDTCFKSFVRPRLIQAMPRYDDVLSIGSAHLATAADTVKLLVGATGVDSFGVISLYFNYPSDKLAYLGIQSEIPGRVFVAGVVDGRVAVQWFDATGGSDPIPASTGPFFTLLFDHTGPFSDVMHVEFDRALCGVGGPDGKPLADVLFVDAAPCGTVVVDIPTALIGGHVAYYLALKQARFHRADGGVAPDSWGHGSSSDRVAVVIAARL